MKTMRLEIEDSLYDRLIAFIGQLPAGQARVLDEKDKMDEPPGLSLEEATAHVLAKNAELYERLS
uniref:Uncharacterized protein n=1 Tax=Candidatus Kentrum sp. FM TaxID=2126340 RepID=A0A450STQ5_9GAMM|nr:MAG: hypothetical protein BECKFM1743A_GA0114220_101885 [Candidatus Kentron sp. FM]VFJ58023.1 MAG: hypothetical protein BECKFM1743C_GA0114222_102144 [Candidatus Kentron sp. FM]VFK11828.1 MAG: hypothetical protein BECKFM1743B_GA0114221_102094 [Candidatus Kentron sp. FM]